MDPKDQELRGLLNLENLDKTQSQQNEAHMMQIREEKNQKQQIIGIIIKQAIENVDILKQVIQNLKTKLIQQLDLIIIQSDQWILKLNAFFQKINTINIDQFSLDSLDLQLMNIQIEQCNEYYIQDITRFIQKYDQYEETQQCIQILQDLGKQVQGKQYFCQQEVVQHNQEIQQDKEIQIKLIDDSIIQKEMCYAIDINQEFSLMISGKNEDIVLWNFQNGKINEISTLKAHSDDVQCLKFSKKQKNFISGSKDNSLICWKCIKQNQWIHSQQYRIHIDWIECFILNQKEDQLIVGSKDKSITIWNVDFKKNKLHYLYTLNEHTNKVCSISFNISETQFATCGYDHFIIWEKNQEDKWQVKYKQDQQYQGEKIKFINDNQFLWVTEQIEKIQVFQKYQNIFQEDINKELQLTNDDYNWDESLFPIIQNIEKNVIVIRQKRYIYLLRIKKDGNLEIIHELNCNYASIYGTMTENTQYLIFWNYKSDRYLIYEILYK
ncbi:unnamed protein product [Paramecium pentaurelia]|uniref:WD40-repeat-containing domain n=1 Tax=Paramecium pentaurelia TaxID=43138 RepID=A0A8S1S245_9CILI|nr:unnamed protein product [Paramecium pentaurelia]